ncbi:MAG: cytochrome b5-like heme/steroid binding domain-containing protein [Patescibacteria group bacterium]
MSIEEPQTSNGVTKTTSFIIGAVLIIGIGGLVFWQKQEAKEELTQQAAQNAQNQEPTAQEGSYTLADISGHKDRSSCWSTINGGVYDLTSWIPKHPGGEQAILQLCGTDGSAKFNRQHGGAALQAQVLTGFKVGTLAQ